MPDTTSADPVAAYLDKVRRNHRQHVSENFPEPGICISRDGSWPCDAARLLAAVEAVLERHQPRMETIRTLCPDHRYVRLNPVGRDLVDKCPACSTAREPVCVTCPCGSDAWPCAEALAISEALTGKEGTNG